MNSKTTPNQSLTPIGRVLDTILEGYRCNSAGGIRHLAGVWKSAVGPPICDNAKPFAVKGKLLLVHVSSSVWLHQLRFLKTDILERLNSHLAHQRIEDIKFKVGPI